MKVLCLEFIFLIGDLSYFESVNKETLMNAFKRLEEMEVISFYTGLVPPHTRPDSSHKQAIHWVKLHPDYVPVSERCSHQTAPGLEDEPKEKADNLSTNLFTKVP